MTFYYKVVKNRLILYKNDGNRTFKYYHEFMCWISISSVLAVDAKEINIEELNKIKSSKLLINKYIINEICKEIELKESRLGSQIL